MSVNEDDDYKFCLLQCNVWAYKSKAFATRVYDILTCMTNIHFRTYSYSSAHVITPVRTETLPGLVDLRPCFSTHPYEVRSIR
jgi:hypothetical protein